MSATIFNGWHLLTYGTATNIIFVGAAVLVLRSKVRESREYMAAGNAAFASAEERAAELDRTRNLPWYWPTGPVPAIEAAPAEHEAEVLAVAYPTQELRLVADDPQVAAGLARLADEVGLVQALSDRPAEDDDLVGDERPGEAWFAGIVRALNRLRRIALVAVVVPPLFVWSWCVRWPIRKAKQVAAAWRRRRDERYLIGSGDQATDRDPFAELLAHVEAPEPEPVRIVRVNRYRDPGMTGQFPYVKVAGAPRHAAPEPEMPAINAAIPAQRNGGDDL